MVKRKISIFSVLLNWALRIYALIYSLSLSLSIRDGINVNVKQTLINLTCSTLMKLLALLFDMQSQHSVFIQKCKQCGLTENLKPH